MDQIRKTLFSPSDPITDQTVVKGYDFNQGLNYSQIFSSYLSTGFQATHFARAIDMTRQMLTWRLSDQEPKQDDPIQDPQQRKKVKCTIFLAYTSNMISCGLREVIRYLVEHKLVDVLVTSGGGIQQDLIKCLAPTVIGDFHLDGHMLRQKGFNRIGNLLMPNNNYCLFQQFMMQQLDQMLRIQKEQGFFWTPSKMIEFLGNAINHQQSVYYWAAKNKIPVFCPGITDGSIGDMLWVHSFNKSEHLRIDIVQDVAKINNLAMGCVKSGQIILGGGLPKHHTNNANLMRNGADFSVYINTGIEHEGSDSGAAPDEAVSWGKINGMIEPVKVFAEATLVFPVYVAETFVKYYEENLKGEDDSS